MPAAVLLDALIVRSLIVPALMFAFGRANWALPKALDHIIPRLNVEPGIEEEPQPPASEPEPLPVHTPS